MHGMVFRLHWMIGSNHRMRTGLVRRSLPDEFIGSMECPVRADYSQEDVTTQGRHASNDTAGRKTA